jgi:dethiobiotin synthetase
MSFPGRGVFITGTGTGVGKTVAAAAVLAALRSAGIDAVPMKPVQTGGLQRGGALESPDLEFCLGMAGLQAADNEADAMAPYLFEPACSPHLAALRTGRKISFDRIAEAFDALSNAHQCVVVEGAGGLLVPISEDSTMLDLMARLRLPAIIVASPGLGTINHTLLSLREIGRAGLPVLGVIFCETEESPWGEIEEDNWKTIERMGKTRVLGRVPFMAGLTEGRVSPEEFRRVALRHLSLTWS